MLLWFLGTALLTVWYVFTDPRFDYRLLLVGAVLPDVIDLPEGHAKWAHSLTVAVGVLVAVMVVTSDRGLCGAFNTNINKRAEREWRTRTEASACIQCGRVDVLGDKNFTIVFMAS